MSEHLGAVCRLAASFAEPLKAVEEARLAALLHDLGKYSEMFQRRLAGLEGGLDHWSPGAFAAIEKYGARGLAAALVAQGHHVGLQQASWQAMKRSQTNGLASPHHLRLTARNGQDLLPHLEADGLALPAVIADSLFSLATPSAAGMLDLRMLFSVLVDADYLATEAHFEGDIHGNKRWRDPGPPLEPAHALKVLREHIDRVRCESAASVPVNAMRDDLLRACLEAAESSPGVFTMSAPTGGGKTLAMLAFALSHAHHHGLRRVVMVIPYLSIIDQSARICRSIFEAQFGPSFVLEHHSLAETKTDESIQDNEDPAARARQLLAENWDAPLIITTSVQCLESLFANRPGPCRKLHRLARSVVLFDEVQTLPPHLAVPTLAGLSRLAERYESTVLFSTATQPAFARLDGEVRKLCPVGWRPREVAAPEIGLFRRVKRTRVDWEKVAADQHTTWEEVVQTLRREDNAQVLCIVNLVRHARLLAERLRDAPGLLHLSAWMCPAHRERVLKETCRRLDPGGRQPCRLVSTQCVEAGVDLDFPVVYRAFGPLEAIAQAAGRCNRNGSSSQPGRVVVFRPAPIAGDEVLYPSGGYRQAADVTEILLRQRGSEDMDIDDPHLFTEYYGMLYDLTRVAEQRQALEEALCARDFVQVAREYRVIDEDTVNILVPYDREAFQQLRERLFAQDRLTRDWIREARPHTIAIRRPRGKTEDRLHFLTPAPLTGGKKADDWFLCEHEEHYDRELLGWNPPAGVDAWMI